MKLPLILQVSRYVFKTLSAFGVYEMGDMPTLGAQNNVEDAITPVMDALRDFRDQVKRRANDGPGAMFQLSDEIRDEVLPYMGIKLEDRKQD